MTVNLENRSETASEGESSESDQVEDDEEDYDIPGRSSDQDLSGPQQVEITTSDETCLLGEKKLQIKVDDGKYNPGGFFSFSYTDFSIKTEPFGWSVRRRELDFVKLREYYTVMFPQYVIPPLITCDDSKNAHKEEMVSF